MNVLKSEYISCLKIHGVPLLPPVMTQESRKEMGYYKMLAISTEQRIAALKSSTTLNANASIASSNTRRESASEQQELDSLPQDDDKSIHDHKETQELKNHTFKTSDQLKEHVSDNVENNGDFTSLLSDITVIDVSTTNMGNSLSVTSTLADKKHAISEHMTILQEGYNFTDTCLVAQTTEEGLEIIDLDKVMKNTTDSDSIDGKPTIEKEIEKNTAEIDGNVSSITHSPDSLSISESSKRLENFKKISGSLNDLSSTYLDSPKLVRQRSYTIEHPSPVLLAHLEVQSMNSGKDMSSISMSESCATLPRFEKKRPSWDLEMAKVKWTSMTSDLNKRHYNIKATSDDKQGFNEIDSYPKQNKHSPAKDFSKNRSPTKNQQTSRKTICKDFMTSLQNVVVSSNRTEPNSKTSQRTSTKSSNQIPLRRTSPTQRKSLFTQNVAQKVTGSIPSQSDKTVNANTIQEMVEKIQTQQVMQMAALLEKQKLEQLILQKSFEEQKNIFMKQLKQMCPNNPSQGREGNKENLDVNKSPDSETDKFMTRCEEVLKKGRIVLHDVKMGKILDSPKTPGKTKNSAPVNLQTIFTRPKSIDTDSNSSGTIRFDCVDNGIMTDRTNDTLADLNFTLSSDPAEDSCRFETKHNNSNSILDVNETFILDNVSKTGGLQLDETFMKSQPSVNLDSNDNSMNTQLHYIKKPARKLFQEHPTLQEKAAATRIVAWCRGYLVRRLLRTARVQATVQTIRDALCCALQLHRDREGIRGADIDLHRRLIQQITAACYSLHDTFISSSAAERCEYIAHDRERLRLVSARQQTPPYERPLSGPKKQNKFKIDRMSQSHSGVFPSQTVWSGVHHSDPMTRSNYGTLSIDDKHHGTTSRKCISGKEIHSRKPWR